MDHFTLEDGGGILPALKSSQRPPGGRPAGYIIPKYVNADPHFGNKNFLRGYYLAGDSHQELYGHAFGMRGFGREFRRRVSQEIPYHFGIYAQGEYLPRHDNYVKLDLAKKDAWGIPVLHINASYGENERAMARAMHARLNDILDAIKVDQLQPPSEKLSVFGKNIHECLVARQRAAIRMKVQGLALYFRGVP